MILLDGGFKGLGVRVWGLGFRIDSHLHTELDSRGKMCVHASHGIRLGVTSGWPRHWQPS